jgi:hypothetical protein
MENFSSRIAKSVFEFIIINNSQLPYKFQMPMQSITPCTRNLVYQDDFVNEGQIRMIEDFNCCLKPFLFYNAS